MSVQKIWKDPISRRRCGRRRLPYSAIIECVECGDGVLWNILQGESTKFDRNLFEPNVSVEEFLARFDN